MRCQLHLDVEAASICVGCGRALCRECQQTTRDERIICGLPQCEEFVKRQKAVQFAVRQMCVNNAETQLLSANLYRHLKWIFIVFGWGLIASAPLAVGFNIRAFGGREFVLLFVGFICLLVAWAVHRLPTRILPQSQNWADISREFAQPADSQPDSPNGGEIR